MNRVVQIWTIQLAQHRVATAKGIPILDITAKSGIKMFSPEFNHVMDYKNGNLSETAYTDLYVDKMHWSLAHYPNVWKSLLSFDKVAVACYCSPGAFCHRHIFKDLMTKYLNQQGVQTELMGELVKPKEGNTHERIRRDG